MTPRSPDRLGGRGHDLEEEFFRREDQKLIEKLRKLREGEDARAALARVSGITRQEVLERLVELGITPETYVALSVVPLVEVAWADGALDPKERAAILQHAGGAGFTPGSAQHALLEAWLEKRPEARLLSAWKQSIQGLTTRLTPEEAQRVRARLLDGAQAVARASGGVLGLGSKVSQAEKAVLADLESAFGPAR